MKAMNRFLFDRQDATLLDGTGLQPDPELAARNLERAKQVIARLGPKWCAHRANSPITRKQEYWRGVADDMIAMMPKVSLTEWVIDNFAAQDQDDMRAAHSHTEG